MKFALPNAEGVLGEIKDIVREIVALAGAASIVRGAWLVYEPAAWGLAGILAIVWAALWGRK